MGGGGGYPLLAAHFAGASNQFLSLADNAALSMGAGVHPTFALWVYPESLGVRQIWLNKNAGAAASREYLIEMESTNQAQLNVSNGTTITSVTSTPTLALNTWAFIAAYYDGTNIGISVNNQPFDLVACTNDIQDSTNNFRLGLRSDAAISPFTGRLDSVGVWKRVLSQMEINQLYKNGTGLAYRDLLPGLLTNLIAWYDLDDAGGSGATWLDKASTNHLTAGTTTAAPTSIAGKR